LPAPPAAQPEPTPPNGLGGQTNPSKTKHHQIKPSKIAWFYLVLFVRIRTFQWVTANPNKKIFPYVTLWLNGNAYSLLASPCRGVPKAAFDPAVGK
jgi:hypothetical protein